MRHRLVTHKRAREISSTRAQTEVFETPDFLGVEMYYAVKKIDAHFCAKVFACSSSLTIFVLIILFRIIVEPFVRSPDAGAVQGVVEGLLIGRAMSWSLLILVPTFLFGGYLTGFAFATLHNIFAGAKSLILVKEGSFEFK